MSLWSTSLISAISGAHACLLCFDLTRKVTYKNLENWYRELRQYRPKIPVMVVANKVDSQPDMAKKNFKFVVENELDIVFVSARYVVF
jgi:Rab-like protein 2